MLPHAERIQVPRRQNVLACLPIWASRWLGYRVQVSPEHEPRQHIVCLWSFLGAFCGVAVLQAVFGHTEYFGGKRFPPIVASFGASAVLIYGVLDSPLAQPRALFGGHFIAALLSISITKVVSHFSMKDAEWLAGSLCVSTSIVMMQITKTTHPPAGATALLVATNPEVQHLGWLYLPAILLSCLLSFAVALIVDNVQRRYPLWWFSPSPMPSTPIPIPSIVTMHSMIDAGRSQTRPSFLGTTEGTLTKTSSLPV